MGSIQTPVRMRSSALLETSCGYLLQELQARTFFFFFLNLLFVYKVMAMNVSHPVFFYH